MNMIELSLNTVMAEKIEGLLRESGYNSYETTGYTRYCKGRGDSVFVSHSLNIVRATKYTVGDAILHDEFGSPNGITPECEKDRNNTWFFNGYHGKRGTII